MCHTKECAAICDMTHTFDMSHTWDIYVTWLIHVTSSPINADSYMWLLVTCMSHVTYMSHVWDMSNIWVMSHIAAHMSYKCGMLHMRHAWNWVITCEYVDAQRKGTCRIYMSLAIWPYKWVEAYEESGTSHATCVRLCDCVWICWYVVWFSFIWTYTSAYQVCTHTHTYTDINTCQHQSRFSICTVAKSLKKA